MVLKTDTCKLQLENFSFKFRGLADILYFVCQALRTSETFPTIFLQKSLVQFLHFQSHAIVKKKTMVSLAMYCIHGKKDLFVLEY